LKSFSGGAWYYISRDARTCDCAQFRAMPGPPCKHLTAVGIHSERRSFLPTVLPTFSQALSGLVKSLRLRRPQDAVYWLVYLDTFREPASRLRMARRLLIGSAEDGHSIEVMEAVVGNFPQLVRTRTDILYPAAEVLRICKMPNWWHPLSGGKDYIYSGLLAERKLLHYTGHHTLENMTRLIEDGIAEQDTVSAIAGVMGLSHARLSAIRQAEFLASVAAKTTHSLAQRLVEIHLRAKSALSGDNNFLCQAAWMMAGGYSPLAERSEPVFATEVFEPGGDCTRAMEEPTTDSEVVLRWPSLSRRRRAFHGRLVPHVCVLSCIRALRAPRPAGQLDIRVLLLRRANDHHRTPPSSTGNSAPKCRPCRLAKIQQTNHSVAFSS
jgi:hypothetical protein